MKLSFKHMRTVLLSMLGFVVAICSLVAAFIFNPVKADAEVADKYYQSQLGPEAKKFYSAIQKMDEDGTLKTGKGELNLTEGGYVTATQLANFSSDSAVMKDFGAARDAYSMDHPELFYIDLSYLSINVGSKNGQLIATLGTGRADNYFIEGGFNSTAQIEAAITAVNNKITEITTEAKKLSSVAEQVTYVNKYLAENVTYDFVPASDASGSYIHNPYGAFINNAAVCEGYSRAFKMVMDKLDIPCVLVQGYARTSNAGDENETWDTHMWNNVKVGNLWYGVDCTWNSTWSKSVGDTNYDKYLLLGSLDFNEEHTADTVVSAVGFEFTYPILNAYNYGGDTGGFDFTLNDDNSVTVSYSGKSAAAWKDENKYLSIRFSSYDDSNKLVYQNWTFIGDEDLGMALEDDGTYTTTISLGSYASVQFALFTVAPDGDFGSYTAQPSAEQTVTISGEIGSGATSSSTTSPYAIKLTPSNSSALDPTTESYEVTIQYSESLRQDTSVETAAVSIVNKDGVSLIADGRVEIKNFTYEGDTVKFTLIPSKQFSDTDYILTLVGLVGTTSGQTPDAVSYRFWRKSTVCSKVFNDGRLWMNVYGTPNLVSDSDLSVEGFKDSNGNLVSKNQRSQLMLVASKPSDEESKDMVDKAQSEMGVSSDAILESSTYEIDLLLCGCVQTIPDGSYMQVGFGFPEGYGPEDAGATFKVYHYKSDGSIEEVPCVVTEYGIIATVSSFSPYAIIAVKSDALPASTTKSTYARTVGLGGDVTVAKNGTTTSGVVTLSEGDKITYTFAPETGYKAERIILNGVETILNGQTSIEYNYSDLKDNNILEVYFVAESVAQKEADEGITPIYASVKMTLPSANKTAKTSTTNGMPAWLYAVIAVAVVFAVAAVVTVIVTKAHKKSRKEN